MHPMQTFLMLPCLLLESQPQRSQSETSQPLTLVKLNHKFYYADLGKPTPRYNVAPRNAVRGKRGFQMLAAPPKEEFLAILRAMPARLVRKRYGVSRHTVRRWREDYGITVRDYYSGPY